MDESGKILMAMFIFVFLICVVMSINLYVTNPEAFYGVMNMWLGS